MSSVGVTKTDAMLNELQKKIYGQRSESLTPIEINRLFQSPITPEFNVTLYRALQRNVINPDVSILQAIARAKTRDYLIPISLCLRYGADSNMYVDAPKLGTIHILGYIYSLLGVGRFAEDLSTTDENVLNTIVIMLICQGSKSSLPIFDKKAGKINPESETNSSVSVLEWLNDQGYNSILNNINIGESSELQKKVDKDSLTSLSILLDKTNLASRDYESRDLLLAIRAFSPISFDKIPVPSSFSFMDYKSLDDCVTYINSSAYEKLLKKGQLPSYVLVNKILVGMKLYKNTGRIVAFQELEKMLLNSISVGTQLDQDQLSIISVMGQDVLKSVTQEYEVPYWRKICKSSDISGLSSNTPEALKRLAISLNIDHTMTKGAICENISNLSKANKEDLKEAARRRQQFRVSADVSTINEFLGDKIPNLVCRNKVLMQENPFDYNDYDLAYYRDDQGAVWCFGSESFSSLLETGINPYNSTVLPQSFKSQLQHQINVLKTLGINADHGEIGIYSSRVPLTFEKSVDSLTSKDVVSEKYSQISLNSFIQLAARNSISPETIKNLSKDQMTSAFRSINYNVDLSPLSTSHSLVTTSRIIDSLNKLDPDSVKIFFNSLNSTQIS